MDLLLTLARNLRDSSGSTFAAQKRKASDVVVSALGLLEQGLPAKSGDAVCAVT